MISHHDIAGTIAYKHCQSTQATMGEFFMLPVLVDDCLATDFYSLPIDVCGPSVDYFTCLLNGVVFVSQQSIDMLSLWLVH